MIHYDWKPYAWYFEREEMILSTQNLCQKWK